ncbi:dol-P-Glc:Glc(2)Man(9)GlcNAc(2)-PP-Dol alpha-1,2-glucosyltransferase [Centruroides vittatus]|uniref:dol-P-Glc:Glc(2)Man(9)GlcNAc(2)-PP-Dol alpha-1,2-glucosyltransferase n=1 Tax=Centruroides vittatus TaxID=120091 RepID=UPI00351087E4
MAISIKIIIFCITWCCYGAVTLWLFHLFTIHQNSPYMDEIFHVKQAEKYCDGNFSEWDDKITTPPGLYLVSIGILVPASSLFHINYCTTIGLRIINVAFSMGNMYIVYVLHSYIHKTHQNIKKYQHILSSLNLALFPLSYFFTFLYYTDSGALFFILLMYLFHLMRSDGTAALFGLLAVLFRQTSIIWVFFVAVLQLINILTYWIRRETSAKQDHLHSLLPFIKYTRTILLHRKQLFHILLDILKTTGNYVLIGIGFVLFVIYNHGIVLGDKSAHQACFNFPQILYFLGFFLCFSCSYLISFTKLFQFIKFCQSHFFLTCFFCVVSGAFIYKFTYVHPYLIADNRHLTFYIWRKILGYKSIIPYLYIPLYLYSAWSLIHSLSHKSELWKLTFIFCLIVSLIPQQLLEFRYFIIPYIILRLNMNVGNWLQLLGETFVYVFINIVALYLFFYKTFHWPDSNDVQRIMW